MDGWMDGWMEGGREGGMDGFINLLNHAFERNDDVLISISSAIL